MESACQKGSVNEGTTPGTRPGPSVLLLPSCVAFGVCYVRRCVSFSLPPAGSVEPFPLTCALVQIPPRFPATLYLTLLPGYQATISFKESGNPGSVYDSLHSTLLSLVLRGEATCPRSHSF